MTKNEFMDGLRLALAEQMDESEAAGHIQYYETYIETELRTGKREEDIIAALGNPRLIAKSLADVSGSDGFYAFSDDGKAHDKEEKSTMNEKFDLNNLKNNIPAIIGLAVTVIVVLVVLSVVTKIAWAIVKLLIPIVILLVLASFIWKTFLKK